MPVDGDPAHPARLRDPDAPVRWGQRARGQCLAERQGLAWPAKEMRCRGDQGPFWDAAWLGIAVAMAVLVHRYLKQSCSRSCVGSIDDSSHHHLAAPVPPPAGGPWGSSVWPS